MVMYGKNNQVVYLALSRTEASAEPRNPPAPLELALAVMTEDLEAEFELEMAFEGEGEGDDVGADSCWRYILVIRRDRFL